MENNDLILPTLDYMNTQAKAMRNITEPLEKVDISFFSHTRIYNNNTLVDMSNRIDVLEYFYYESDIYKYCVPDIDPWALNNEYILCSSVDDNPCVSGLRENNNIDNIIVLIEKYEKHCELWYFGSDCDRDDMTNFYINNLDVLKAFTLYFKEQGKVLINDADKNRIKRIQQKNNSFKEKQTDKHYDKETFYKTCHPQDIHFNHQGQSVSFTKRETEVIKWSVLGKTSTEIALILSISKRTVETHMTRIKQRLQCYKLVDVMRILAKMGLVESIINS